MKTPTIIPAFVRVLGVLGVLLLVGCDHVSKHVARERLMGQPAVKVIDGVLQLRYTENRAMSFGMMGDVPGKIRRPVVTVAHTVGLGVIAVLFWRLRHKGRVLLAGLGLALAGGAGNLIDRLARGYVIDFIHLQHWPVFNLADVFISAGVALLAVSACLGSRHSLPSGA